MTVVFAPGPGLVGHAVFVAVTSMEYDCEFINPFRVYSVAFKLDTAVVNTGDVDVLCLTV